VNGRRNQVRTCSPRCSSSRSVQGAAVSRLPSAAGSAAGTPPLVLFASVPAISPEIGPTLGRLRIAALTSNVLRVTDRHVGQQWPYGKRVQSWLVAGAKHIPAETNLDFRCSIIELPEGRAILKL